MRLSKEINSRDFVGSLIIVFILNPFVKLSALRNTVIVISRISDECFNLGDPVQEHFRADQQVGIYVRLFHELLVEKVLCIR